MHASINECPLCMLYSVTCFTGLTIDWESALLPGSYTHRWILRTTLPAPGCLQSEKVLAGRVDTPRIDLATAGCFMPSKAKRIRLSHAGEWGAVEAARSTSGSGRLTSAA